MCCLQVFDLNRNFLRKFGSEGSESGQFNEPTGLAVDSAGNLFVSDMRNSRVVAFKTDGTIIATINVRAGSTDFTGDHYGVCVARDGRVLVGCESEIQIFAFPC